MIHAYCIFAQGNFTVLPNASITISSGTSLKVNGNLTLNSDISGTAALIDKNIANNVKVDNLISVKRYLTGDKWHCVSSPVDNLSNAVFSGTNMVYYYNEPAILNDWDFGWEMLTANLSIMKGYDVKYPIATTVNYTAINPQTLNSGAYNINVTNTNSAPFGEIPQHRGWNLIGNPYPSPIDWDAAGWTKTNIDNTIYFWNSTIQNYSYYIGTGGNDYSTGTALNNGSRYIPAMQGFWVKVPNTGSGNVSLDNSVRVLSNQGFYKNRRNNEIKLIVNANDFFDETLIRFNPNSGNNFDSNYDAYKLFSKNTDVPQLSSRISDASLAINTLTEIKKALEVKLSFFCGKSGEYSISSKYIESIDPFIPVYLEDCKEELMINLREVSQYNFFYNKSDQLNRFVLHFDPPEFKVENMELSSLIHIFSYEDKIYIKSNTTDKFSGYVEMYDMNGRIIMKYNPDVIFDNEIKVDFADGCYVVRVITNYYTYVKKVIVKKV